MEPTASKVSISTRVNKLEQRFRSEWAGGIGKDATYNEICLGWFIHLEGSWEMLYVGYSKPDLNPGDMVRITLEKVRAQSC